MSRACFAVAALILIAAAAGAQLGGTEIGPTSSRIREFLEGQPITNEIARFYFWQDGESLLVRGWLGEKMSIEEAIFVKLQPVFDEKGHKKVKARQLFPKMRQRLEIDLEFPAADGLKVESRYATTGGRIQTGKTSFSKRFEVPPPGSSVEVLCQRTAGLGQCRCDSDLIDAIPTFPPSSDG
jgi:hypothetical protein